MAGAAGRGGEVVRASVWLEEGKGRRRGGQPSGLDRERIVGAAVRLLDAEGLAKFSMRRLAGELDVTAMSVYWYVDTKDDLLELALDRVFGEVVLPGDDSHEEGVGGGDGDWREQLRGLAKEYRALLVRHPWVSPLAGTFLNIGPHSLDFSLAVQRVIRRTGLPAHGQTGAIAAVFQFVYGFGTIEGHFVQRSASAGMTQEEYFRHAMSAVADAPQLGELVKRSADLMEARGGDTIEEMRERDFGYALDTLITGIEAMVERG
ncbi:TetR/AcrR family transcriptional regulator [Streptomyces sp. NPDC002643]